MGFIGPIEDRLAIRELYNSYSDATMRQDRDLYLSLWCEDGVRKSGNEMLTGKSAIAEHWDGVWSMVRQMGFFSQVGAIKVKGASATARVYCREWVMLQGGDIWKVIGRYDDVLEKRGGDWLFQHREYQIIMDEARPPEFAQ